MEHSSIQEGRTLDPGASPAKGLIILGLLAVLAAFTGGASRYDAIQIIPLRALSALFLIPALYYITLQKIRSELALFTLLVCFVLLVALQLIPLPPGLWQNLPGRGEISVLDEVLGFEGTWRPLTMAPMRTWNVLGSLIVPASGLLLAIAFRVSTRSILRLIAMLGVLNALLGLLQIMTGRASVFYIYEVTNRGGAVGIFANENHAGIFAACSLLIVTNLWLRARDKGVAWERLAYPMAFLLILLTSLVGGSRAGFAAAFGAVVVSILMVILSPRHRHRGAQKARGPVQLWFDARPQLLLAFPVLLISLIIAAFVALDRMPAFRDILSEDSLADLRWSLLPIIGEMLGTHWVLGSGLGSFEQVYHIYEPSVLLMPQYINQAHNDWAQVVIEGGVVAGLLLVGLMLWMGRAIVAISLNRSTRVNALFWVSVFSIVGVASMVDYPLRTPLFQLVMVWLLVALSRDIRGKGAT